MVVCIIIVGRWGLVLRNAKALHLPKYEQMFCWILSDYKTLRSLEVMVRVCDYFPGKRQASSHRFFIEGAR